MRRREQCRATSALQQALTHEDSVVSLDADFGCLGFRVSGSEFWVERLGFRVANLSLSHLEPLSSEHGEQSHPPKCEQIPSRAEFELVETCSSTISVPSVDGGRLTTPFNVGISSKSSTMLRMTHSFTFH